MPGNKLVGGNVVEAVWDQCEGVAVWQNCLGPVGRHVANYSAEILRRQFGTNGKAWQGTTRGGMLPK